MSALAASAPRGRLATGADLADPRPAARARLAFPQVDREEIPDLGLEGRWHCGPRGRPPRWRGSRGWPRRGRRSPRARATPVCGTGSASRRGGSRRCRRCRCRPRTPGCGAATSARRGACGCGRATWQGSTSGRPHLDPGRRRGPGWRGRRPRGRGRPCPSGSGPGSAPRPGWRRPAATWRHGSTCRVLRAADARTEAENHCRARRQPGVRRGQLESPGEHRVDDHAIAVQLERHELAAPADTNQALTDEGRKLGRRAPQGQGAGSLRANDRAARKRGMERVDDDGKVGQFGHGRAIVGVIARVLDSRGPGGQELQNALVHPDSPFEGARTAEDHPRTTIARPTA